jgi:hypothetical protein
MTEKLPVIIDNRGGNKVVNALRRLLPNLQKTYGAKYMQREVLPNAPDAWVDQFKTKIGYEINFSRYFYKCIPPRLLEEIESDLKQIEKEIADMLAEVTE